MHTFNAEDAYEQFADASTTPLWDLAIGLVSLVTVLGGGLAAIWAIGYERAPGLRDRGSGPQRAQFAGWSSDVARQLASSSREGAVTWPAGTTVVGDGLQHSRRTLPARILARCTAD